MMTWVPAFAVWLFPFLMVLAATSDVLTRRIPNKVNISIFLLFFPAAWIGGLGAGSIAIHFACGLGILGLGFVLFSCRLIGGGDAKLLAAASIWFGPDGVVTFISVTALAGGLLAIAVIAWKLVALDLEVRNVPRARLVRNFTPNMPYGYAITAGALIAFSASW